ncbi:MAG TPA: GGDEF domain-containing protein [Solirubrobacterales bacterium]
MTFLRGRISAWKRDPAPAAVRALVLIAFVGGLSALIASLMPPDPGTPVALFRWIGILTIAAAALFSWLGNRMPPWLQQVSVAAGTLIISVLVASAATSVGMVITASDYLWMAVYAAFFFSPRAARAQVALIAVAFAGALILGDGGIPEVGWFVMTASFVVVAETISRQSERLRHEAHTDPLTGLLNRKGLALAAERAFSLADRTGIPVTVALLDLDDFKGVNDTEGHAAGDRLLAKVARVWGDELEPEDILARLGGDEFLLVLLGSGCEEADRILKRLRLASPAPWSVGVVARQPGEELSHAMASADAALYAAKRSSASHRRASRSEIVPAAAGAPAASY